MAEPATAPTNGGSPQSGQPSPTIRILAAMLVALALTGYLTAAALYPVFLVMEFGKYDVIQQLVPLQLAVGGMIGGTILGLLCCGVLFWGSNGQLRWVAEAAQWSKSVRTRQIINIAYIGFMVLFVGHFLLPVGRLRLVIGIVAYSVPFLGWACFLARAVLRPLITGKPNQ
jgi:hypothetical protein